MDVSPTSGTAAAQTSSAVNQTTNISSDFETFLRMLTVQLENQDPLNPVEADDYAVQLATFSSVEQQVLTNDLLKELTAAFTGDNLASYADWVGREVRVPAQITLEGEPVTLVPDIAAGADRAFVTVTNEDGLTVTQFDVPVTSGAFTWDGKDELGRQIANGTYDYTTTSLANDTELDVRSGELYVAVREAQLQDGRPILILENGTQIAPERVTALRIPEQAV